MHNFYQVVKSTPKRKIIFFTALSFIFAYTTMLILSGFLRDLFENSVTISALNIQLLNILGYDKYNLFNIVINLVYRCLFVFVFLLFTYLFYRHEKQRQFTRDLDEIIQKTSSIGEGDFRLQLNTADGQLDVLIENLNNLAQELKQSLEEERHVEHMKNELITNVSHDLRTPLTSIVGYLRLIEQDKYQDEVALRYYTGIAFEKALQLEKLINELFEYTRMQDHQLTLNIQSLNIAEILGQVIVQNEFYFKENKMVCREDIIGVKSPVPGDGDKLARVFENLIVNAIHYGKEGIYVDVVAQETDDQVVVAVINYGNPIPSFDLPHIFERFYRVEKSRTSNNGGAGLGLAIAKSIITHHGGTIEVQSNFEKTSFIVKLNKQNNL